MLRTALLLAAIAATPASLSAASSDGDGQRCHHGQHLAQIKAKFDADHDGKLDEGERAAARAAISARIKEKHPQAFAKADTDGNGELSREELKAWRQAHGRCHHHEGTKAD